MDAAIACRELHDLRSNEQTAIEQHEVEESNNTRHKAEATTQRNNLVNDLATYEADHPDTDDKPTPDNHLRKQQKKLLHDAMDAQLATRVQRLKKAVAEKDTQQLWMLTTAAMETGFVDYFSLEGKNADQMKGRSKVRTTTSSGSSPNEKKPKDPGKENSRETFNSKRIREIKRRADNHRTQANRLTNIARDLHANARPVEPTVRGPLAPSGESERMAYKTPP